jgi:GNAT superfamily N-acetyltransferase
MQRAKPARYSRSDMRGGEPALDTPADPTLDRPTAEPVRLRDGAEIFVRPVTPRDKRAIARGLERLSEESRYRRFFAPVHRLSDRDLAYLTEVDHHDHEALVAYAGSGEPLGVARYVRLHDEPSKAEVAVAVVDDWQGRGVATELLAFLRRALREAAAGRLMGREPALRQPGARRRPRG